MAQLTYVNSQADVDLMLEWADNNSEVPLAVDTETTGLRWNVEQMRSVQIGDRNHGFFVPIRWSGEVDNIIRRHAGSIVMHNWKFDAHFMREAGLFVHPHIDCTKTIATLAAPERRSWSLKPLTDTFHPELAAGGMQKRLDDAMKEGGYTWRTVPESLDAYWQYGALDVVATARVFDTLGPTTIDKPIYEIEMKSQEALYRMEHAGMPVDVAYAKQTEIDCRQLIAEYDDWAYKHHSVVLNKKASVTAALRDFKLPLTPTGEKSLAKGVLSGIDHPVAKALLGRRSAEKLAGFMRSISEFAVDGRVHPLINPLGAVTGRMSMQFPNLQQTQRTQVARRVCKASGNHVLILSDYDQIELRVFAILSGDPAMIEACRAADPHTEMAKVVWPGKEINAHRRQVVKNVTYAILYGSEADTLAYTAGITYYEARDLLTWYRSVFSGVNEMFAKLRGQTSATTLDGRRMCVDYPSQSYKLVNYMIQGTSADILKKAIIRCDRAGLGPYMRIPVHDELIFEVPKRDAKEVAEQVKLAMLDDSHDVPLTAQPVIVKHWGEKYE